MKIVSKIKVTHDKDVDLAKTLRNLNTANGF